MQIERSAPSSHAPLIRSISGGVDRCASPAATLRLIGQLTGHLPAKRRPSDLDRRLAAAVVAALGEMVTEQWDAEVDPWLVEVPESPAELVRRTGASENEVRAALRLLIESSLVASVSSAGQRRLRLSEDVFEEIPPLARMDGSGVRRRLERIGASTAPALAVLRELALASGGHTQTADPGPWIEASLAHLSETTLYKRTAVSRALSELETARLVERATRSGRHHSYRLLPQVFAADVPEDAEPGREPQPAPVLPPVPFASVSAEAAPAQGLIVEIGGVRLRIAPGIECSLELDPAGTPVLKTQIR